MGDTISSLVFRPPKPTPIHQSEYFYLDVDVHSPLCTNKTHRSENSDNCIGDENGGCGGTMCLDTGESDLASLDAKYGMTKRKSTNPDGVATIGSGDFSIPRSNPASPVPVVNNLRNGQMYKIPAFFIRRRNATQTLLFSHGNAEDLGMMYNRMKDLAMVLGVNIMAYDYTGYGLSIPGPAHPGNGNDNSGGPNETTEAPSENMIYRNIEAAYRYLTLVRKIPPHQIILYGRSLGSGPSCYLAAKSALNGASVGGLVLHSPFLSVYKVVADLNGLDLGIVGDLFHNEKRARNVRCPTLIIHGRQDEVVPFWHAPRLLAAVPPEFRAQPFYVDEMGHNHIESRCREPYVKVVLNFLRMNVWNNRNNSATRGGLGGGNPPAPYRGPSPIPVHERALASDTKENASFYINKTWLRHAKVLLKEVFADAGCYVGSSGYQVDNNNNQKWEQRSNCNSNSTVSMGSTGTIRSRSADNARGRLVDARDDDEDEFAPWRAGGNNGSSIRRSNRTRSTGGAPFISSDENIFNGYGNDVGGHRGEVGQHRGAQSEKILTARRDNGANRTRRSRRLGIGSNTPRYDKYHTKSKSMMMAMDRLETSSVGVMSIAPRQPPKKDGRTHVKSKSLQLLEMSRQRRY